MRRKKRNLTRIAKEIECSGEYCGNCERVSPRMDGFDCAEFHKELKTAEGKKRAERLADCHMAERLANGEKAG